MLEVVHKEAGGCLIPYYLQPTCLRNLEVIWGQKWYLQCIDTLFPERECFGNYSPNGKICNWSGSAKKILSIFFCMLYILPRGLISMLTTFVHKIAALAGGGIWWVLVQICPWWSENNPANSDEKYDRTQHGNLLSIHGSETRTAKEKCLNL